MRITTANASANAIAVLQQRQQQLAGLQDQITSGKRITRPSDDPGGAARAERALAAMQRNEANQRALDVSRNAVQLGEQALGDAGEMLQQARELVMRAGAGSFSAADRRQLAESVRGLRGDLLAVANRDDGAGRFLFGGQGSDVTPLLDMPAVGAPGDPGYLPPRVAFQGSPGLLQGDAGEPTLLALDGQRTWLDVPDPANPGQTASVFDLLDRIVTQLNDDTLDSTQRADAISAGLAGIDSAVDHLAGWRSRTGVALNRIDGISQRLSQAGLDAEAARAEAQDTDLVQAISSFKTVQTSYDAALQTYASVQKMSLFDYLR